nr:hypothetical protein [Tanacetum cinerariifolium]
MLSSSSVYSYLGVLDGSHDDTPVAKDGEVATVDVTPNQSESDLEKEDQKSSKKKKKNNEWFVRADDEKWSVCLLLNQKLKQSTLCHLEECTRSSQFNIPQMQAQSNDKSMWPRFLPTSQGTHDQLTNSTFSRNDHLHNNRTYTIPLKGTTSDVQEYISKHHGESE